MLLRISEVADRLGLSQISVRRLVEDGRLDSCTIGKAVRVSEEEVARLVRDNTRRGVR